jgi:hypothetical protein
VLLPQYLTNRSPQSISDGLLDSWPAIESALHNDQTRTETIRAIAREISALVLHDSY